MRVIVTRPLRECRLWVSELEARGLQALALPLIDIAPAADAEPVRRAWQALQGVLAAMFVSGNAVEQFFAGRPEGIAWPSGTRGWATGPGTTRALLASGVAPVLVDAPDADAPSFDSEALWRIVQPQCTPGQRVLIVRGADASGQGAGRNWFAEQLEDAGCTPQFVVAYERHAPRLDALQLALARAAATDGSTWLFSSSEAVNHLVALLPGQDWRQARAITTHPRIAQAARDAGFTVVCESRPALGDVVASIESIA